VPARRNGCRGAALVLTAEFSSAGGALLMSRISHREFVVPRIYAIVFSTTKGTKSSGGASFTFLFFFFYELAF